MVRAFASRPILFALLPFWALLVFVFAAGAEHPTAAATKAAGQEDCVRGQFKNYWLEGVPGYNPSDFPEYVGPVFTLSQDYPNTPPEKELYPWLAIPFENGGPTDPRAYLEALLEYGLEGNVEVDFYVQNNAVRPWYVMPWMDWNTEIERDYPGTDGREFVHGFTHEFDTSKKTLSRYQDAWVDTWSGAYFNDRGGYGIGQVWCDPNNPDLSQLNPNPKQLNSFLDGSFIIKILFSTVTEELLPTMKDSLEWTGNIIKEKNPDIRANGPFSVYARGMETYRLLQIDVAVRDDRSLTGWLFGTFAYNGFLPGETVWERMQPLGLQWGNNPQVTVEQTCNTTEGHPDFAVCRQNLELLSQQWLNEQALIDLDELGITENHLGMGGRLAGPVDNPNASCLGCHQTAAFPPNPLLASFSPGWNCLENKRGKCKVDSLFPHDVVDPDDPLTSGFVPEYMAKQMAFTRNTPTGVLPFAGGIETADYSLQLSMSVINFMSLQCKTKPRPTICQTLIDFVKFQSGPLKSMKKLGKGRNKTKCCDP